MEETPENAYQEAIDLAKSRAREFLAKIDALDTDTEEARELALSLADALDQLTELIEVKEEEKVSDADITPEEWERVNAIESAETPHKVALSKLVDRIRELSEQEPKDNRKARMGIKAAEDFCDLMGIVVR